MAVCSKCGSEISADKNVCDVCGTPFEMFVKKGSTSESDVLFEKFKSAPVQSAEPSQYIPRAERRRSSYVNDVLTSARLFMRKHWKWLVPGVAVIITAIVIICLMASIKPDYGLLALTSKYTRFDTSESVAEGGTPLVGLMRDDGKVLLPSKYQNIIGEVDDNVFAVIGTNGKIGTVNATGKELIPCEYIDCDTNLGISGGLLAVCNGDQWGFVNNRGKVKIDFDYVGARGFSEGLAAVFDGNLWGYIDASGKLVIDYAYDDASYFNDGLARICIDGMYGFIDKNGSLKIAAEYDDAFPYFDDGLCLVKIGHRYGYINKNGEYVINPQFDDALPFSKGLAAVQSEDKIGYINTSGKYVILPKYEGMLGRESMFYEGAAVVGTDSAVISIDKTGNNLIGTRFRCDYISHLQDGFYTVCVNGKYGIISKETNEYILKNAYDTMLFTLRNVTVFEDKSGNAVYINNAGEIVATISANMLDCKFLSGANKFQIAINEWCDKVR